AAENTKTLINQDKVFALFGYVGTPTSQASLPIFTEARVPYVAPFTGAELLRSPTNRYIFNVRASYFDETEAIVQHLTAMSLDKEGRGVQISQVVPFPWDPSIPVVKEYKKLMDEAKAEPGFGTLEGYIGAKVMVEGLRRAGRKLDRESFIRAMETLNDYDVGG